MPVFLVKFIRAVDVTVVAASLAEAATAAEACSRDEWIDEDAGPWVPSVAKSDLTPEEEAEMGVLDGELVPISLYLKSRAVEREADT